MACKACRAKKIKCDRVRPVCQNCKLRSFTCSYAGERRTKHWIQRAGADSQRFSVIRSTQNQASSVGIDPHIQHAQPQPHESAASAPPHQAQPHPPLPPLPPSMCDHSAHSESHAMQQDNRDMLPPQQQSSDKRLDSADNAFDHVAFDVTAPSTQTPSSSTLSDEESLLDRILQGDEGESLKDSNPCLWLRTSDGDEYTGPSSGIATISDVGLKWVRENVPDSGILCETIQDIRNGVLDHLRQPKCIPMALTLLPPDSLESKVYGTPDDLVSEYVEAYFSTVQVIFPILDRTRFESQLRALGTGRFGSQNPSWQALLGAVLASGCRASLSSETADGFRKSGQEAWGYFQHALSFESRITHGATDLMAVQAMAIMTIFAQGLSSPQRIEYTLSSTASRLAQGLALHRHPLPEWNLDQEEQNERNRVFWVIYCLDRSIALRCGRPAVISDEDVSCTFLRHVRVIQTPHPVVLKDTDVDFFLCFTRLSRICGKVSRSLYSVSALFVSAHRLLHTMNTLLGELRAWLNNLPASIRPGQMPNRKSETFGMSTNQTTMLHLSYYYILCAIYRRFTPMFTQEREQLQHIVTDQIRGPHIEAARSMVLLTKHLDIESFTPAWLVFYYPFTALTTIFVHIVTNPNASTAQSDIALMEMVVGFFGRLEYITSGEAAFTKTTDFVRQAREITDSDSKSRAQAARRRSSIIQDHRPSLESLLSLQNFQQHQQHSHPSNSNTGNQLLSDRRSQEQHEAPPPSTDENRLILRASPLLGQPLEQDFQQSDGDPDQARSLDQQDQTLYADLSVLLTSPPPGGDSGYWLGDWVLAV